MKNYRLATGISDKHRLKILNEIYNPSSLAFLDEHVLRIEKPISILEIGCGHGHMTCILAKALSVNGGTITGRDISENQLEIARDIAKPNKLGNISFERSDISFQDKAEDFFDCTYSRFLLMHLHNRTELNP